LEERKKHWKKERNIGRKKETLEERKKHWKKETLKERRETCEKPRKKLDLNQTK
jgi:hypothetical protein